MMHRIESPAEQAQRPGAVSHEVRASRFAVPAGVPVGTLAIGEAGATNAGLMAAQILALADAKLAKRVADWRAKRTAAVAEAPKDE